ncbi:zinc-dependent alcohol dehydrogenase family protein [Streptomyces fulvoviolaceus]|uniref:zinc-dependent alcohol dehydrogenase family protein n=1 Tax=Streptomyces fulvoviolaceus TaxID=285535 RepID=UPI0004CBA602|nr:zinc-dependent alcohol dehydrogenase family protein [Streptomyces fulvoviolaceus]
MPRIVRLHAFGGPENLKVDELPSRQPGPGEARLRVEAAGLSRDQFMFMSGHQFEGTGFVQPELPSRLGYEVAGVVDAVGEGVDPSWIGKRVAPIGPFDESLYGSLGEEGIVPADLLCEYPATLTPAEAAALWVPYLTAYGVVTVGGIGSGDFVSIPAASSAVGLAAIQIVRDAGATPIAVTRTAAKADQLRALGAADVIVTQDEDYATRIAEITSGRGVRVTFDPIGGDFVQELAAAASPGGIIIEYGILAGGPGLFPQDFVIGKSLTIRGYTVGEILSDPKVREHATAHVLERLADGRFTPRVAKTFQLDQVVDAFAYIQSEQQLGRTVVTVAS